MDKNVRIGAVIFGIVAVVLLVLLLRQKTETNTTTYNWSKEYKYGEYKFPYDIDVTLDALEGSCQPGDFSFLPDTGTMKTVLPEGEENLYMHIGKSYQPVQSEIEALADFVERGNEVFIAAENIGENLLKYALHGPHLALDSIYSIDLVYDIQGQYYVDSFQLKPRNIYRDSIWISYPPETNWRDKTLNYFNLFGISEFVESTNSKSLYQVLEYTASRETVYLSVDFGRGRFYFCSTPVVLSNYFMIQDTLYDHLSELIGHTNHSKVFYDRFNRIESEDEPNRSVFRYIYTQPPLKFAFYLLIFGILLFLVFEIKRRQRPIPLVDQNTNKSLESLQMISRLYGIHPDHRAIAMDKLNYFFHFVRKRYMINTQAIDDQFVNELSMKSGVDERLIKRIVGSYNVIKNQGKTHSQRLLELTDWINRFYKEAK